LNWIYVGLIGLGVLLWYKASELTSTRRWEPVEAVVPSPGKSVTSQFSIPKAGRYELELKLPTPPRQSVGMPTLPAMEISLEVLITGPRAYRETWHVTSLRHVGEIGSQHVSLFRGGSILLPRGGDYVFTITAESQTPPWGATAPEFSLSLASTEANPTDTMIHALVGRFLGGAMVLVGTFGLTILAIERTWPRA
jgi:hypothetical protein